MATRWPRRIAWTLGMLLLAALLAAGIGVGWLVRSEAGAAWLLARVPGLVVEGGHGVLWGDFAARRIAFALPDGGRVVLDDAGWRGLRLGHAAWAPWRVQVRLDELHARRVEVVLPHGPDTGEPAKPPASLRVPLALELAALRVDELKVGDVAPLHGLRGALHLGTGGGTQQKGNSGDKSYDPNLYAPGAGQEPAPPPPSPPPAPAGPPAGGGGGGGGNIGGGQPTGGVGGGGG